MPGNARMFLFGLLGLAVCLRCSANERLSFTEFQGVDSAVTTPRSEGAAGTVLRRNHPQRLLRPPR